MAKYSEDLASLAANCDFQQSAKSLRGGEMADVIFNGSTSRRGLGLDEVTMTFDNGRGSLATDAGEVQILKRRVTFFQSVPLILPKIDFASHGRNTDRTRMGIGV